jgi:hypothetical protein
MADLQHRSEDEDHEPVPLVTTPQGTLAHSVEHGHEERDVNFKPLLQWGIGLAGMILFAELVCAGIYQFLYKTENAAYKQPFFAQKQVPPEPRLIPNVADSPQVPAAAEYRFQKFEALQTPGDYAEHELHRDREELAKLGLYNSKEETPEISDTLAAAVGGPSATAEPASHEAVPGLSEMMPADPSGGMTLENRLR